MLKVVFANIALLVLLPMSAFATNAVCAGYNEYVTKQCASVNVLQGDLDAEMLKGYSVKGCQNDSFKMILETDSSAQASCTPVMSGKMVSALK